jgi:HSP20 family protein
VIERLAELSRAEPQIAGEWSPDMDVYESDGAIVVVVEVPGLGTKDLKVTCKERMLIVSGERHDPPGEPANRAFLCLERHRGRFVRALRFDVPVDTARARARLAGGLLSVTIPQLRERRGRETVIEVEKEEGGV